MEIENISKLSDDVMKILNDGLVNGFANGTLKLNSKGINDDMMDELCDWIKMLEGKINILNFIINMISSKGASRLFDHLNKHKSTISEIHLTENQIDDGCMHSLGNYIKKNQSIERIYIDNHFSQANKITDKGIEILSPYLEGNKTLKELSFYTNKGITNNSIPHLLKMIEVSKIGDIDVKDSSITNESVLNIPLVINILKYGYDKIDLSYMYIPESNIFEICEFIKKYNCGKVNEINLIRSNINSKGATKLFETLKEVKSNVKKINLSENQLDEDFMESFGEFIENSETIQVVKIANNYRIRDNAIEILLDYLIGNTTLKTLDLSRNKGITGNSVPYLLDIAKKTSITCMDVNGTSISEENQESIKILLQIAVDQRKAGIKSKTKSATKIM